MYQYHLTLHWTGATARSATILERDLIIERLKSRDVVRYSSVFELNKNNKDYHLHVVFELKSPWEKRKRDINTLLKIDFKVESHNALAIPKLGDGQTMEMIAAGYYTKTDTFKNHIQEGFDEEELRKGFADYERMVEKSLSVNKHNFMKRLIAEMSEDEKKECSWKPAFIRMFRSTKYNTQYAVGLYTEDEIDAMIHFKLTEPSEEDFSIMGALLKTSRNY